MKKKRILRCVLLTLLLVLSMSAVCSAGWKTSKGKTRYYPSGSKKYVAATWKKIGKKWYYFDQNGYLKTGRFKVGNRWYYAKKSTGRAVNKKVGDYYYGSNGAMVSNCWKKCGKYYFYFGGNGKAKYGKFTLGTKNPKTYYCSKKTGRATKKRVGDYYYGSGGVMVKNTWAGNYYYGSDGKARYGKLTLKGKTYYCTKKSGKLKHRWYKGNFYDENGVMAKSKWINGTYVNKDGKITKGNKNPKTPLTSAEIKLLASLVYCEAGNQPYRGKLAVASVVVNRMESSRFPNTLRGVIYQSGQFTPAMNGLLDGVYHSNVYNGSYVDRGNMNECKKAAKTVAERGSQLKNYYFFNTGYGTLKIGDHYFS